jgi:hypothetical protein
LIAKAVELDAAIGTRPGEIVAETAALYAQAKAAQDEVARRLDALRDERRRLASLEHQLLLTTVALRSSCDGHVADDVSRSPCSAS